MSDNKTTRAFVPANLDPANLDQLLPLLQSLIERPIASAAALHDWLLDLSTLDDVIDEESSRRSIDHSCHTDDEAIEKKYMQWVQQVSPKVKPLYFQIQKKFVESPYVGELADPAIQLLAKRWRSDVELFRDENVPLQTQVTEKTTAYGKLNGAMSVDFRGKTYTLQQIARFLQENDRPTRQEAWEASTNRRLRDREAIEAIFDDLLKLRSQIANNAGLASYREYVWKSFKRFDYTPDDCKAFADAIADVCVPLVEKLDEERRVALGVDALRPWDLSVDTQGREPLRPFDEKDVEGFVKKTSQVFARISPQLREQFDTLKFGRNLDLESRKGKRPGGYQASLELSREPFIFMNAAGMQRDVETLLHEGGHAFNYMAASHFPVSEMRHPPLEFAEVASMSMELLASSHLDVFYSHADAARAQRELLEGIIRFFPWMATIDSFQHWLYTNPGHSRQERENAWLGILDRFGSKTVDWSGYEDSRRSMWQRQLHLFSYPFYYIEYGIAQLGALQIWTRAQQDPQRAIQGYRSGLALGGTRPLPELFKAAGIQFDFSRKTFGPMIQAVSEAIESLPA
jgi:oligoendopeptidase F